MDSAKAHVIEKELKGTIVGGWTIVELINNGKSAAVFKAVKGKNEAALKIFDDELIAKYGDTVQLARIERELSLRGKGHPNMVAILDGGVDVPTNNHYLIMELVEGRNLKERLADIPVDAIGGYISDLASCAEYLESLDLVHRDIKPENIVVSDDFSKVTLLDFGVIKPLLEPGITDMEGLHPFIGTLQYSSPEFLLRKEEWSGEDWRALTFYQLGGVLHDLVMREALFSEYTDPFVRLANAIQDVVPTIQNSSVPAYLVDLAKMCLLKNPQDRLKMLTWDSFKPPRPAAHGVSSIKERVNKRVSLEQAVSAATHEPKPDFAKPLIEEIVKFTKESVRRIGFENEQFPPIGTIVRYPGRASPSVKVKFDKSEAHLIREPVSAIISIDIIDAEARVISLDVCVHISATPPDSLDRRQPFFSGVYDQSRYHAVLEEVLYKIVDQIQRQQPGAGSWLETELGAEK